VVIYLLVFAAAFTAAATLTPFIARTAVRVDILDRPGGRKLHTSAVPRLGGVAVALGLAVALGVSVVADAHHAVGSGAQLTGLLPIIAGGVLVFAAGLWDDVDPRSPMFKLAVELTASVIVVGAGISMTRVTFFGTTYVLGWMGPVLTVLWILVITNAFNLIDGLDGLAGGLVAIAGATCATVLIARGEEAAARMLVALVGSVIGFLAYNIPPARIFLGDSGSLLAGFLLSVTAITGQQKGATTLAAGVPLLIFALPLAEAFATVLRRLVAGQRGSAPGVWFRVRALGEIFSPDSGHLHHRLRRAGLPPRAIVLLLYGLACIFSVVALASMEVP
jgi:UDP-GlcNAc:undecaprenyl-phosphate GlcNAc-1-phosphate transferase